MAVARHPADRAAQPPSPAEQEKRRGEKRGRPDRSRREKPAPQDEVGAADDAAKTRPQPRVKIGQPPRPRKRPHSDRKSGGEGKSVAVRGHHGGPRSTKKKTTITTN